MKLVNRVALISILILGLASWVCAQDDTAALYKSKCQVCHGTDGKGDTLAGKKVGAKDLHSPEVAKLSDTQLFDDIKKGKGKMQAYGNKLSDDQIKALVKYVRSMK